MVGYPTGKPKWEGPAVMPGLCIGSCEGPEKIFLDRIVSIC